MNIARILPLKVFQDAWGSLVIGEAGDGLPFVAQRFFILGGTESAQRRCGYAHMRQSQLLVCLHGVITARIDDYIAGSRSFVLTSPKCGLYLPAMTWMQMEFAAGAQALVLASGVFVEHEYIRNRREFEEAHATA